MMDGMETPLERAARFRRVHEEADRREPFSVARYAGPPQTLRYGKPSLVERVLAWVLG